MSGSTQGGSRTQLTSRRVLLVAVMVTSLATVFLMVSGPRAADAAPQRGAALMITATPTIDVNQYPGAVCETTVLPSQTSVQVGDTVDIDVDVSCTCPGFPELDCYYAIYEVSGITAPGFDVPTMPSRSRPVRITATEAGIHTITVNLYGEAWAGYWNWRYQSGSTTIEVLPAPPDHSATQAALDDARSAWDAAVVSAGESYSIEYRRSCFCIRTPTVSAIYETGTGFEFTADDGLGVDEYLQYSVPSMLDLIQDAIDRDAASIDVSYGSYGVPARIAVDYDTRIADEELYIDVFDFQFRNDPTYYADRSAELAAAQALWAQTLADNGANYTMTYRLSCFCFPEGDITATVVDGDATFTSTGEQIFSEYTVEGLFELIQGAIDSQYYRIDATYNEFGVPTQVSLDYGQFLADDGLTVTVNDFALTDPTEPAVLYAESFEAGLGGWATTSSARTGAFAAGPPEPTESRFPRITMQPDGASDGLNALATDPRAGYRVGSWDIDGGIVTATSPIITLPDGGATLSLDWYWGHAGGFDGTDIFQIVVSPTDSRRPSIVVLKRADTEHRAGNWQTLTADLVALAGTNVQIQIMASDVGRGSLSEAGIDNVTVWSGPPASGGSAFWNEDFETAPVMTVTGDARTGWWGAAPPEATNWRGQVLQQGTATSGGSALITGPSAGYRAGTNDVDAGSVVATLGDIAIPVTVAPATFTLSFDWYFAHLNANVNDLLNVTVVGDRESLVVLEQRGTAGHRGNAWERTSVDITRFQGQTISIVITATDDAARGALIEAGVDTMSIVQSSTQPAR